MFSALRQISFRGFVKIPIAIFLLSFGLTQAATKAFVIKSLQRQSVKPRYTMVLQYPVFMQGSAANKINKVIKAHVDNRVATMQRSFQVRGDNQHQSEFSADVQVLNHSQGRYSIVWLETAYFAGAAHPLTRVQLLNYDANLNKSLVLSDLVTTTTDFYSRLSKLCRQSLRQQIKASDKSDLIDPQWFRQGTVANKKNFATWSFTSQALQIYFAEYSIAPYAAGRFVVNIPWSELSQFKR